MKHFGVTVMAGKHGFELNRDNYAIINNRNTHDKLIAPRSAYTDEKGTSYTDEWCKEYQQLILQNFDLNMRFFASLNHDEFQAELDAFLKENKNFVEVTDLTEYRGVSGYYIMVLDKYCQLYIGQATDIKRRIQEHWLFGRHFDRLLFPAYAVKESILSIDSFRALDTTRIYVYPTMNINVFEDMYINSFPPQYVTNRIAGGIPSDACLSFIEGLCSIRSRQLD